MIATGLVKVSSHEILHFLAIDLLFFNFLYHWIALTNSMVLEVQKPRKFKFNFGPEAKEYSIGGDIVSLD